MTELLARLKQRKLVQWALAYIAAAFALIQVLDVVAQRFGWPDQVEKLLILALAIGFVVVLVIAWYHGERGAQKVSGTEIVILALLLAIGGGLLWRFERATPATSSPDAASRSPGQAVPGSGVAATSSGPRVASGSINAQAVPIPAKSVAVLPFVNMSGDPKNDYFSDGITEEILDALAQVPDLKVAARTSAFAFKGKAEDLREVGQVLDVATVLEGSVQQSGDEVRITAQLIDTRSGYHLWSEKYDRKLTSIFAVEDEISKAIADKLQVQLSGGNEATLVAQKSVDPRAHDFYLRGLTLLAARSVGEAVGTFRQAVAIDPDYAQAWAALAEAQALLPAYGPTPMQTANADSLESARRALAANPDVALAYVAQGMVYMDQMRWAAADGAFRRALALAPGDAEALNQYGQFLEGVGQLEPALAQFDRAWQRDPLSGVNGAIRVQLRLMLHHDDAATAAAQIRAILDAHPESLYVHRSAALIYLNLHRYPEAEAQARAAAVLNGTDPEATVQVIRGIADPALRAQAVHSLETSPGNSGVKRDAILHAFFLVQLGERDRALAAIEDYAAHGDSAIQQLLWFPAFDPIRNDPRFKAALKKMGLPYTPKNLPVM
ncbi:MAG TPA: tetratricopeptide repeat protein [Rhodanobacteraceae bacterium]|nr:tetratricopeptide repeat protein [Rhodanobacteraceae bacterium]